MVIFPFQGITKPLSNFANSSSLPTLVMLAPAKHSQAFGCELYKTPPASLPSRHGDASSSSSSEYNSNPNSSYRQWLPDGI